VSLVLVDQIVRNVTWRSIRVDASPLVEQPFKVSVNKHSVRSLMSEDVLLDVFVVIQDHHVLRTQFHSDDGAILLT